jgi:hypothetical protein
MPRRTMNVYYRDGYPTRVIADDPSLRDVEVNIITNDTPERLMFVAMVAEAEIERFCADQRACKSNTQWHGLSIAAECVGECLMALRDQHYGDPAAMNAAIDDILTRFNAARAQAMELRAADDEEGDPAATARAHFAPEPQPARKGNGKQGGVHQAA